MSFERKSLKKFWIFTCHTSFQRKLFRKLWSKMSFYVSHVLSKKISQKFWLNITFYMSNILGKKFIEENLSFYVYKHPLIESHWRNFENFTCQKSFQRKLLKESKMSFYDVLSKKIIVEILIKNMFLHVKCLLKEINPRNFDKKEVYVSNIKLEPVCCKKRQQIVPDQLLIWGIWDLWRTWRIPNWF